jgi:hypothetical protein
MENERVFKKPKKILLFDKYPFAVLHDTHGNEVFIEWPQAKQELHKGYVLASPSVMGGYFFLRIIYGTLQEYIGEKQGWKDTDILKYDDLYEQDKKILMPSDMTRWLVTNISC